MSSHESLPQNKTDAELLHLIVEQNNQDAFRMLIEKHSTLLMSVCLQILRDKNDAEDAFQNAVIKLVQNSGKIKNPQYVSSWLYQVAQRESLNILRQKKRIKAEPLGEHSAVTNEPEASQENSEELVTLHEELNQLPEKYRAPIILCYLEGKTRQEASAELNVTVNSVKASLTTGRELLKKRLLKRGIALASVLTAWNTSQTSVASAVSSTLVHQALQYGLAKTSVAGTTASVSSSTGMKSIVSKGINWMAVSTFNKSLLGIILLLAFIGVTAGILELKNSHTGISEVESNNPVSGDFETGDPSSELMKIIANIKEKEPLYQDLDITMHFREDHSITRLFNPDDSVNQAQLKQRNIDQYVHQTFRRITQGAMYRSEFKEEANSIVTDISHDGKISTSNLNNNKYQAKAYDGETFTTVKVSQENPIPYYNPNPYQLLMGSGPRRLILFSDLLQGGEHAMNLIREISEAPYPEYNRFKTNILEHTRIGDEPVVVIELISYQKFSSTTKIVRTDKYYLAINRNYLPVRWDPNPPENSPAKRYYQVLTWFEPVDGLWFPETAEMIMNDIIKPRTVRYNFEVTSLNPQYPKSFFRVEETKKIETTSN